MKKKPRSVSREQFAFADLESETQCTIFEKIDQYFFRQEEPQNGSLVRVSTNEKQLIGCLVAFMQPAVMLKI